jgi:intracellular septation protein
VSEARKKPKSSWLNLLVDYGPLLVFFLAYRYFKRDSGDAGLAEALQPSWSQPSWL